MLDKSVSKIAKGNAMQRTGWPWGVVTLGITLGSMMGCEVDQLRAERDELWRQNNELQDQLTRSRMALDAAESDRGNLISQVNQLQSDINAAPIHAAANTGTGFNSIQGVETWQGIDSITVRIPGDVLFASGRSTLRSSAKKTLNQIARVINREYTSNTIRIEGYTDTDPIKKSRWKDNLDLSQQRAAEVHRYLQKQGVDPHRLEAVGLGQWHPRQTKSKSRRVEIVVVQNR